MKFAGFLFVVFASLWNVQADLCAAGSQEINGNYYCQAVTGIQYSNVGAAGAYNSVTSMTSGGLCSSEPKDFSGPLSPLDEEVSLHFRGPVQLKQLAVYTPAQSAAKRSSYKQSQRRSQRSAHQHQKLHKQRDVEPGLNLEEKRQIVTATIDGQVVSWENNWFGSASLAKADVETPVEVTATINGQVVSWQNNWSGGPTSEPSPGVGESATTLATLPTPAATSSEVQAQTVENTEPAKLGTIASGSLGQPVSTPVLVSSVASKATASTANSAGAASPLSSPGLDPNSEYARIGYYDSSSQTITNLVFLGNYGGQGSGVFDYNFGASLSYVNSDGTGGASSPQILADTTIPSDSEVIVMLGDQCENGDCGFVRPGAVTHHGFGGADKVFLIEFSMPMDGSSGFNADMPAIWMLNAQIPRTLQYGNANCSCWESGCGEFDIVEALSDGSTYLKSTLHTNQPAGDSDYIQRPTSGTMKLAIVFSSQTSTIHIQVLSDDTEFSASLAASDINNMCTADSGNVVSHFAVS